MSECRSPSGAVLPLVLLFLVALLPPLGLARAAEVPDKLSVAVVEFKVMGELAIEGGGAIIAEWLVSALGESKVYALRERVLLQKVLAEQALTQTGLVDEEKNVARIGQLLGLDGVVSGSVFRWGNTVTVTARLIDSNTGAIKSTAEIRAGDLDAIPGRIKDLARVLTGQATQAEIDAGQACLLGPTSTESGAQLNLACTTWVEPGTGLEFVQLEGRCYQMGQSEQEKQFLLREYGAQDYEKLYNDEGPRHEVCIDDFWLGKSEVTNRQFRLFRPEHNSLDYRGRTLNDENQPAVYVSWDDANAYAAWLSAKYPDRTFRLPSEAEWELGCRAGTETPRFWGWDSDEACRFANVHDRGAEAVNHFGWPPHDCDDGFVVTAPVGSLAPNPSGLNDMLGNVWEWTADVYRPDGYQAHGRENPRIDDGSTSRVRRGGSWNNETGSIRCANRGKRDPGRQNNRIGFRLLMQVAPAATPAASPVVDLSQPLLELPLSPGKANYKFRFTAQKAGRHALVLYSPGPAPEVSPSYDGIGVSLMVSDGGRQLLAVSSPAMARFGAGGAPGQYGAFFVSFRVPEDLPSEKKLTAEVAFSGGLDEFLARRGTSSLVLIRSEE